MRQRSALSVWGPLALGVGLTLLLGLVAVTGRRGADGEERVAARLIELTNDVRQEHGQSALSADPRLNHAAKGYAREMASRDWFDHLGPDGSTVEQRAEASGYRGWAVLAENLARGPGQPEPAEILDRWLASPTHRRNVLSPDLTDVGIACRAVGERFWCAQESGARRP